MRIIDVEDSHKNMITKFVQAYNVSPYRLRVFRGTRTVDFQLSNKGVGLWLSITIVVMASVRTRVSRSTC